MNRFFITTLFTLLAATQLASLDAMKRAHDDDRPAQGDRTTAVIQYKVPSLQSLCLDFILEGKSLADFVEMYQDLVENECPQDFLVILKKAFFERIFERFLDITTPLNLLTSLITICNTLTEEKFVQLTSEQEVGACLAQKLINNNSSLITLLNAHNATVLHLAADNQNVTPRLIRIICCAAGDNVDELASMQNNNGETALHLTAYMGHTTTAQTILNAAGVIAHELVIIQDNGQETALHLTAFNSYPATAQAFLNAPGVSAHQLVIIQSDVQHTALHSATCNGSTATVQAILNTPGVNVQQLIIMQDNNQETALDLARRRGYNDIVALLEPYMNPNNQ